MIFLSNDLDMDLERLSSLRKYSPLPLNQAYSQFTILVLRKVQIGYKYGDALLSVFKYLIKRILDGYK